MVDQIRSVVLLVLLNYFILALWRVFGRPTILMRLGGPKKVMKGLGRLVTLVAWSLWRISAYVAYVAYIGDSI